MVPCQAVKSEAASNTKKLEGDIEQEKEAAKRLVEKAIAEKEQLKVVIEKLEVKMFRASPWMLSTRVRRSLTVSI